MPPERANGTRTFSGKNEHNTIITAGDFFSISRVSHLFTTPLDWFKMAQNMDQVDTVFLLKAIKEREIIDLGLRKKDKILGLASRFLKLHTDQHSIVIQCPSIRGICYQVLGKNDPVSVVFSNAGFHFRFTSRIIDKTNICLENGEQLSALTIQWPTSIGDHNRRSFFRWKLSTLKSLKIIPMASESKSRQADEEGLKTAKNNPIDALLMDISEAGMAIQVKSPVPIKVNDRLRLCFYYPVDGSNIEFLCRVRNIRNSRDGKKKYCGLQFINSGTAEYGKATLKILRYIISTDPDGIQFVEQNRTLSKNFLIQKIADREVKEEALGMVLDRELTLPELDYFEALFFIAKIEIFKIPALENLKNIHPGTVIQYCQERRANHQVVNFALDRALTGSDPETARAIVGNPNLPVYFSLKIARQGTPEMLDVLLSNRQKIREYPEIADVMKKNPVLSERQKNKLDELKQDLDRHPQFPDVSEIQSQQNLAMIPAENQDRDLKRGVGQQYSRNQVMACLEQINKMSVSQRAKLALTGDGIQRLILANDSHDIVLTALAENPELTDRDRLVMAKNRKMGTGVIDHIIQKENWISQFDVVKQLLKNPNFPGNRVQFVLARLAVSHLQRMVGDEDLSPVIKEVAARIVAMERPKAP